MSNGVTYGYGLQRARNLSDVSSVWQARDNLGLGAASSVSLGFLTLDTGSVLSPALNFLGDPNTGFYLAGADQIGIGTGGVERARVSNSQIEFFIPVRFADGAVGSPGICFGNDPDTGFYRTVANQIQVACNGGISHRFSAVNFSVPDGTVANPAFTFLNNAQYGMGYVGGHLNFSAGGVTALQLRKDVSGSVGTVAFLPDLTTAPSANPAGGGYLYVEAGALKYRGSGGTVTTLGPA